MSGEASHRRTGSSRAAVGVERRNWLIAVDFGRLMSTPASEASALSRLGVSCLAFFS